MKLSKKATEARRKVLDTYPTAQLIKYRNINNEGRYGVFVTKSFKDVTGFWLEVDKNNSSTKEKAWVDAHKAIMKEFLNMLESS